jgi:ABC-2 type transport system permease protein
VILQIKEDMPEYSDPVKSKVIGFFGEKSYINFIFPSILIMIVMWMATFLSSINFIRQKNRGILRRIYVSPMSTRTIAMEKITANTIISLIPLPFILFISFFILGIEMSLFNAIFVFLAASLSVIVFAIIGLIIGSFSRTETTAILGSLIIIIPLMFMSGALYPVEAFPATIKMFTEFLPINTGIRLVEGFLFYAFNWVDFMFLIYTMVFYVLFLSGVCWFFMRRSLKA